MADSAFSEELKMLLGRLTTAFERNNELLSKLIEEKEPQAKLMPLSEAWQVLGYSNYKQCWRKIRSKHYRVGYEVVDRRSPNAADPEYWLDIEKCKARDSINPAKRSA